MIIQVQGLSFSYNSHPTLKDVNFSMERGMIMAFLGVNGAGKSTLLKCINGILRPAKGAVMIEDVNSSSISRRMLACRIGYVPQRPETENLTVFDAVLLGRRPHVTGRSTLQDLRIVEDTLGMMNLQGLALRPLQTLSGGEIQKVIIARALAQQPDILLLDEPTSHLDMKNAVEVTSLLKQIVSGQNISLIAAMHDLNMALRFADVFLLIKDGAIYDAVKKDDLKAESIREVFGVPVSIGWFSGQPVVVPLYDSASVNSIEGA